MRSMSLEFPAIAERLANATASAHGAELARSLVPSADPSEVARRQALTAEAVALLDAADEPPLEGLHDVREPAAHAALRRCARGRSIAERGRHDRRRRSALVPLSTIQRRPRRSSQSSAPRSTRRSRRSPSRSSARSRTTAPTCATPHRRSSASCAAELRTGRQRVNEKLEQLVRSGGLREHLQEDFVTQRGGRPVLAVKASARRSVPGIVHDTSDSGQTLFVEPFDVVDLNNRQSEAVAAEREEVERILRELSGAVGERADAIVALVEAMGAIDLALARGVVSRGWRGATVEISDEVRLVEPGTRSSIRRRRCRSISSWGRCTRS